MMKFLVAAAVLGSLGGAGGGTLAATMKHSPRERPVEVALGKPGKKNTLAVPGVALAAGDQLQRPFDLSNSGGAPLAGVALTTTAPFSSGLDTDVVNGLQMQIDSCAKGWKAI